MHCQPSPGRVKPRSESRILGGPPSGQFLFIAKILRKSENESIRLMNCHRACCQQSFHRGLIILGSQEGFKPVEFKIPIERSSLRLFS